VGCADVPGLAGAGEGVTRRQETGAGAERDAIGNGRYRYRPRWEQGERTPHRNGE